MLNDSTLRIDSTRARTRINTFLVRASFVAWTIGIDNTFGMTSWWTTDIARQTRAYSLIVYFSALSKATAWRWPAAVILFDRFVLHDWATLNKCVSFHSGWASAHR
ncbi:MAG: hypothetical protein EOP45_08915 [Sphingobacteriaceae bacterium]|nr:MAG: hypothetical protein EOP45_08915 [Sphingobacteriaceae bacterium]